MSPSKAVLEKARRLRVLDLTRRYAFVEGWTSVYAVWFQPLQCTCPAGLHGVLCSHLIAVVAEHDNLKIEEWNDKLSAV